MQQPNRGQLVVAAVWDQNSQLTLVAYKGVSLLATGGSGKRLFKAILLLLSLVSCLKRFCVNISLVPVLLSSLYQQVSVVLSFKKYIWRELNPRRSPVEMYFTPQDVFHEIRLRYNNWSFMSLNKSKKCNRNNPNVDVSHNFHLSVNFCLVGYLKHQFHLRISKIVFSRK